MLRDIRVCLLSTVIARIYHVVDCKSISVICVRVTRNVLKYIMHYAPLTVSRTKGYSTLLLPPTIYMTFLVS